MKYEQLFEFAQPYLEENEMGISHTSRVLEIAKTNYYKYGLDDSWKDAALSLAVLHDFGGPTIKEQYSKGPKIARMLLERLGYQKFDISLICTFIAKHHERLNNPHEIFQLIYDSDKLVMLTEEEFYRYDSNPNIDWNEIISSLYSNFSKEIAICMLNERRKKDGKKKHN